ncbi:MAG: RNA 2',3'-cyclic phosphodiesterase [Clostridiales bacterium]|jgi:2'-5' RNA ligase|nr:RNA 2',3'-cyclic phosphodiesterase [Clostridiales bacterium]
MRTFVAILLEQRAVNRLYQGIEALRYDSVHGNFTRKENLHLTMVFIGDTTRFDGIKQAMNTIHQNSFVIHMDHLGRFQRRGGDLYWVGLKHCQPILSLYHQIYHALKQQGFPLENREYKPHLTLGREVLLSDSFNKREWETEFLPINSLVSKVSLMKSERIKGVLTYTELYSIPLV